MKCVRYVVLRVEVEHDESVEPEAICEEVTVSADAEDGAVVKSEVVGVYEQAPTPRKSKV